MSCDEVPRCYGSNIGSCGFLTVFSLVTCYSTIKAKVIVETALPFLCGKFTVFSQFVSNGISGICGSSGSGRFCGLVVVAVIVIAGRTIRLVLRTRRAVVGFVIGFISVRICLVVGFLRSLAVVMGFFAKTFPVTSINGVC